MRLRSPRCCRCARFVLGNLTVAFTLMAGLLAAEGGTPSEKDAAPRYGGTLVIGVTHDVDTFNPLFSENVLSQEVIHLVLRGLADLDANSEFVPELAESWSWSPDHRRLTYRLRRDARWSDGAPVTAEDVAFTFELLRDSTVASPRYGVTEYIEAVRVLDPHTVAFAFSQPYPDQLFDTAGEIVPKHVLAGVDRPRIRTHAFGAHPLANGPFALKKWVKQQYIELVPNPTYFGPRPYLDRVIFKIVPDNTNLLLQLENNEIDVMMGVPPAEAERLQRRGNVNLHMLSGRLYYYLGYNTARPLFANPKVRRALTTAIDRNGLIQALLFGYGRPCVGPIPPMLKWAHNDTIRPLPYDPDLARRWLAEAGWRDRDGDGWLDRDGRPFRFTIMINTGNPLRADLAVVVQEQLRRIGVNVQIQTLEWSSFMSALREKDFDAYMGGWSTAFNPDLTPIFHSSATDLFNFVSYRNPEVDALIEKGRQEIRRERAARFWKEAQARIYADQPYTFLFWIDKIVAVNLRVKNATPVPLSALYKLERWYVEQPGKK